MRQEQFRDTSISSVKALFRFRAFIYAAVRSLIGDLGFVRYSMGSQKQQDKNTRKHNEGKFGMPTVKALFLAANPASTNRLAIDEEMRAIEQ